MTETKVFISKATKRNWDKLKNSGDDRLMRRANKSRSQKTIVPDDYVMAGSLPRFVEELRQQQHPINDLIFSLCAMKIEHNKVDEANAKRFFEEYTGYHRIELEVPGRAPHLDGFVLHQSRHRRGDALRCANDDKPTLP